MESEYTKYVIENNILKGKGKPFLQVKYGSLAEMILDNLKSYPDFVGQIDAVTRKEWKYEKMLDISIRCALWMKSHSLLPEDVVVICSNDNLDVAMTFFATLYLGGIIHPLDMGLHENDFRHLMNLSKPKMAFVGEQVATTIARVAEYLKLDLKIVVFGQSTGFFEFKSIIAEAGDIEIRNFKHTPLKNSDQIAVVKCSSGTSGIPKGIALSQSVLLKVIMKKHSMWHEENLLFFTPIAWYSGTISILMSGCHTTRIVVTTPFEEKRACELIEKHKINFVFLTSSMINRLLFHNVISKYDLSNLKIVLCSGSTLSVTSQQAFTRLVPNATIALTYALTEVGDVISRQTPHTKIGSCGLICEDNQVKVIDPSTGETLGPNQQGELLLKTKTMMNGYYNDPQATADVIDEEGWMHSGDLGYFDEDGEVYVVDRLKELIKYRGQNISPVEIENVLLSHPGVMEVAVVGLAHPVDDEHPIALVVKTDTCVYDEEVTKKELIDFVAAAVSDRKQLRGGVIFVEDLPKTPSGKIQRRYLRPLLKSLVRD